MRKCLGCGTPEDLFIVEGKLYCLFCLPGEELPLVQRADILLKRVQARRAGDEPRREPRGWQKRLNAALLLTVWAIPLMALARAPRRPSADAPIQVPISTKFLGPDGRTGTLAGTLTLTWDTPTPPPVTDLKVSWLAMAPAAVTAGQSATVTVQMNQAWPTAVVVTLASADIALATVPSSLTVPAGASKASAPVTTAAGITAEKLVAITARYGASGGSANLRVLPSTGPPPPPVPGAAAPQVDDYRLANGEPLVGAPAAGSEVRLIGRGFGSAPGRVVWQGAPLVILGWSETLVRVRLPASSGQGPSSFGLFTAAGGFCDVQMPRDRR